MKRLTEDYLAGDLHVPGHLYVGDPESEVTPGGSAFGPGNDHIFKAKISDTVSCASETPTSVDLGTMTVIDPEGWLGIGSYDSSEYWGQTFAEGTWLSLPSGVYAVFMRGIWGGSVSGSRQLGLYPVGDELANESLDPFLESYSVEVVIPASSETESEFLTGITRVQDGLAPMAFAVQATQDSGDPLDFSLTVLTIMRLSTTGG